METTSILKGARLSAQKCRLVADLVRGKHVEQALNETPEKLNRDRRLVLLSDPVTMARLHFRVWNSPERYSSWVSYYEGIKLNPLALRKPDAASQ